MKALCPVEISFGDLDLLITAIRECSPGTVVMADQYTADLWQISPHIREGVASGKITWISQIRPNPTQLDIIRALDQISGIEPACILAIGGGSAIDLAKAVSTLYGLFSNAVCSAGDVTEAIKSGVYRQKHQMIDVVAVPSTAGTGSEMTQWATVWDEDKKAKYSIDDASIYVKKALIIPELTVSMPAATTVSTAFDALCHACEAFWARQTSPVVKDIAVRAVDLVMKYLPSTLKDPTNLILRRWMMRGALLAGIAFSQTHTTACHSISYPMTMLYGVPHGLACALTLDPVARINRPVTEDADLLFDVFDQHGGLEKWLAETSHGILSMRLRDYGIHPDDIDTIADRTFTAGRMDNNPVELTIDTVRSILKAIY
jgi:alcohol dehydrogenase class IV